MRSRSMNPFIDRSISESIFPAPEPAVTAPPPAAEQRGIAKLIGNFQMDDYILIGIIAVLFFEGCDDYMLLAALGYLFLMGIL